MRTSTSYQQANAKLSKNLFFQLLVFGMLIQWAVGIFGLSLNVDDDEVNAEAIYSFQVSTSEVTQGTTVKITVPFQLQVQATGTSIDVCESQAFTSPSTTEQTQLVCTYKEENGENTIEYTVPTTHSNIDLYTIFIGYIKNPPSTIFTDSFAVKITGTPNGLVDSGQIMEYSPGPLYSASLTHNSDKAGEKNTYTFIFKISNTVPRYGYIRLTFPPQWTSAPSDIKSLTTIVRYGTTITALDIKGAITSSVTYDKVFEQARMEPDSTKDIVITLTDVPNPPLMGTTESFIIETLDDSEYQIDKISSGLTVSITEPGSIELLDFKPSSYVVDAIPQLVIDVKPSVKYSSGGYIELKGPQDYITSETPAQCNTIMGFKSGSLLTCTAPTTSSIILKRDLGSTSDQFHFFFSSLRNPLGVITLPSFQLFFKDSDNNILSQKVTGLSYTTIPGTCSVSLAERDSSNLKVGATGATYTMTFRCATRIPYSGEMQFFFPEDQVAHTNTITCEDGSGASIACSVTQVTGGFTVTSQQWCTTTAGGFCSANTDITLKLVDAKNPGYIATTGVDSVEIKVKNEINNDLLLVSQKTTDIYFSGNLEPGEITTFDVSRTTPELTGAIPTYSLSFTSINSILTNGYVKITFPTKTAFEENETTQIECSSSGSSTNCGFTNVPDESRELETVSWTSLCSSGCSPSSFSLGLTNVFNPFSIASNTDISYKVQTFTPLGALIDEGTVDGPTFSLQPNTMTVALVSPSAPIVVGEITTYKVNVQNQYNRIPSSSDAGKMVLKLPEEVQLTTSSCSASADETLQCSADTTNQLLTITGSQNIPKGSTITVTMASNVRNPQTGATTSPFLVNTFSGNDAIDESSSLTVTADTPNDVLSATSVRSDTLVSNPIVLNIGFTTTNPIPPGAIIKFSIPKDQAVNPSGFSVSDASGSGSVTITTALSSPSGTETYYTFSVNEWCSDDNGGNSCPPGYTSELQISGFSNPSTAETPTNSVKIEIFTSNNEIIDSVTSGLFTTPYVNRGPLDSVSIQRTPDTVGVSSTLQVVFVTKSDGTLDNGQGYVFMAFPVGFLYSSATTCTSKKTSSATANSVTCSLTSVSDPNGMGDYVQSIRANLPCSSSSPCAGGTSFTFDVSGLINPYNTKSQNGNTITTATQQDGSGVIEVINSLDVLIGSTSAPLSAYETNILDVNFITRSSSTVDAKVEIEISFDLKTRLEKNGYIEISIPKDQFIASGESYRYQQYQNGNFQTQQSLTLLSTSTTYTKVQIKEWCSGNNNYCSAGTNIRLLINQGFRNLEYVKTATQYFLITTYTNDLSGKADESTTVQATPDLTAATITINTLTLSSTYVAATNVNLDISLDFGSNIYSGSQIQLTFDQEFVRTDEGLSCADFTSGSETAQSCTYTSSGENALQTVSITDICSSTCLSTNTYVARLMQLVNLLYQKGFTGMLIIQTRVSSGQLIGEGQYQLSNVDQLSLGIPQSMTVTRSTDIQGQQATFDMSWNIPGILLDNSIVELQLPLNQIIVSSSATQYQVTDGSGNALSLTETADSPTTTHIKVQIAEWKCNGNCNSGVSFSLRINSAQNPFVQSTNYDDFLVTHKTTNSELIFQSSSPLLATPPLAFGPITNIQITMDNSQYVKLATEYVFSFETSSEIPIDGRFKLTFPQDRIAEDTSSTMTCKSDTIAQSCSVSWGSQLVVTIDDMCQTSTCPIGSYTFSLTGNIKNPPTVKTIQGDFIIDTTDSNGYIVNQGTLDDDQVNPVLPQPFSFQNVERSSQDLNIDTNYQVTFRLVNDVPSDGLFRIIIPLDQVQVPTSGPNCRLGISQNSVSCPTVYRNSNEVWIEIEQTCTGGCTSGTTIDIILSSVQNPSTFSANEATSSWKIFTMNSNKEYIDGVFTDIVATPPLLGTGIQVLDAELENNIVHAKTNFKLKIQTGLSQGTTFSSELVLDLYLPDGFAYYRSDNTCYLLSPSQGQMSCFFENYPSGYIKKITLDNPCPNQCDSTSSYIYQVPIKNRGDVYPVPGEFLVIARYTNADVGIGTLDNSLVLLTDDILSSTVYNEDCDTIEDQCPIWVKFKLSNNVPNRSGRGRIHMKIPDQISTVIQGCSARFDISSAGVDCQMNQKDILITHNFGGTIGGQTVLVSLHRIQNPESTRPTDSFQISTQWDVLDDGTYFGIDQRTTGISYKVNGLTPPLNVIVQRDTRTNDIGLRTGQPTNFWVNIQIRHPLQATSSFHIVLPKAAELMLQPTVDSYTCFQTDSSGRSINMVLCQVQSSTRTIVVRNYCQLANCGKYDWFRVQLYSNFMQNFFHIVDPLDNEDHSIGVKTTTFDGLYFIDGVSTGIFPTPALLPGQLIMPSPEIARTSNILNTKAQWIVNFQINKNPVGDGGYLSISIPEGVLLPMDGVLDIYDYDSDQLYEDYDFQMHPDGSSVKEITIKNFCNSDNKCTQGQAFSVMIDWIKNPNAQLDVKEPIIIETRTPEGYLVERGITPNVNDLFSQLVPVRLMNVAIKPLNPIAGVVTAYDILFSADADFHPIDELSLQFPSETQVLDYPTTRQLQTQSSDRCRSIFEPSLNVRCEIVSENRLLVKGLFMQNNKHYGVTVQNIQNPDKSGQTSSLLIKVQDNKGLAIASKTTQTRISILEEIRDQTSCNKVCNGCAGATSTCTSCKVPSKYPIFRNQACVDNCGEGYFFDKATYQCYTCSHSCQTCFGPGSSKCFECKSGYFMHNGECIPWCPRGLEESTETNQCIQKDSSKCSANCATCSQNSDYCLSCDQSSSNPLYDATQGTCIPNDQTLCNNNDSTGFYIDKSSLQCQQCSELCQDCFNNRDSCTSCSDFFTNNILNEVYETCVDSCGLGTWYNQTAHTCSYCNPVCLMCEGYNSDQCTVCNKTPEARQLYLYESHCVLQCPAQHTADVQINVCLKGQANILSFSFIFMFATIVIALLIIFCSCIISKGRNKIADVTYAVISILEFINRVCLLGNLWVKSSVYTLALCFMNILVTCAVGVFFNFLYMSPIYAHSPHFRQLYRKNTCTYKIVTAFSYFGGVNVMRLIPSGFYGLKSLKADLTNWKFYVLPLNSMANFTLFFTLVQTGLVIYIMIAFTVADEVFILGIFGLFLNAIMIILQFFKHLSTRAFMINNSDK